MVSLNKPVPGVTQDFGIAAPGQDWASLLNAALDQLADAANGVPSTMADVAADTGSAFSAQLAARYVQSVVMSGPGIDPTGATDSTAALRAKFATSGAKHFQFPAGTYKIDIPEGETLATFTNRSGVTIDASRASLVNNRSYLLDTFTPIFLIDGGRDFSLTLQSYVGYTLADPATKLGYLGAILVRAINGADGIRVDATATNLRYAVQTGEYGDGSKGNCKHFDVKLRGQMIGYGFAGYLASAVRVDMDIDGVHRAIYMGGCDDVRGIVRWKDQYVAPIVALCTDALVSGTDTAAQADPIGSPTTSRGCSNIDLTIIDKGSTTTLTATVCAGISPSRVDPVAHRKIRFNVFTVGTDTVSTTVGGFIVASTGTPWSRYPNQWEPWVVLEDIEISGIVDHSAQTAASNSTGELYIYTQDPTNTSHFATVRRLRVSDLTVLKSPASSRSVYVVAPGATDPITIRGVDATGSTLVPIAPAAAPFVIERSRFASIDNYSTATVKVGQACKIGKINGGAPVAATEAAIASAGAVITQKEVTLTLTGASVSWTNAIPPGSLLLGVQGKINTAITGPTRWQLGISGDVARFADRSVVTAGYVFGPSSQAATEVSPKWYSVNTTITLTAYTTAFTGGEMRLVMTYITFPDIT